ncbi:MAG: SDR family oxidoreductase [Bdellovibrionota bacterium]
MKHQALITGGSRGIGEAIAGLFRDRGIEVLAPSRAELDLSNHASVERWGAGHSALGIDILVNNAGINLLNPIETLLDRDWEQMIQVNLTAPMQLIRALSPGMKKAGWGRILNISSVFSLVTREKRAAYSATKSAVNGLTRTVAIELAPSGILVNALGPGYVETELTRKNNSPADLDTIRNSIPLGRLAAPVEIAKLAWFLASEENTYLTGQTIIVDGGFSCR